LGAQQIGHLESMFQMAYLFT